jgi:pimeloyl-ACP methyl ester carboxylesterase
MARARPWGRVCRPASRAAEGNAILPPRFEGTFRVGRRRRLGYAEYGSATGRPLIWFHGTPGARRQVSPHAREVAYERDLRLIAIERPGIGDSTPHVYRTFAEWAADVEKLCDALGLDRVGIAGLSGGGPYALACAHEMPGRVVAVAVLGGVAPALGEEAAPGGLSRLAPALSGLARLWRTPLGFALPRIVSGLEPLAEQAMDLFASFMPPGDQRVFADPAVRKMFIEDMMLGSRRHMQAFLLDAILFGRPWGFSLRDIRVPVHMWYGDADVIVPLTHGEHMARRIPHAVLRVCPEEGHLGGLGASVEIFDAILGHWDDE